jgi:hypothetical protein
MNGSRSDAPAISPPNDGPSMLPSRKLVDHMPAARPRSPAGLSRRISPTPATVNITEPMPANDRNTSSCV